MTDQDRVPGTAPGVDRVTQTQRSQLDALIAFGSSPTAPPLHPLLVRARATARAYRTADAEVSAALAQIGLSTAQCLVLEALIRGPRDGINTQQLSAFLGNHRTSASAVVDCLAERGWIHKSHDPGDGRKKRLGISEIGERALTEARNLLGARPSVTSHTHEAVPTRSVNGQ